MNSGIDSLHKILKDENRRRIILLLREKGSLSYTDLMKALGITNTGKMNYHLKVLDNLLSKKDNRQYALTEEGMLAFQLLSEFPEKTTKQFRLSVLETLFIGLAGFLLVLINPFIWVTYLGGIAIFGFLLSTLYATFVPSAVMWCLTTCRAKSHDLYELFKAPLFPAFIFTSIFILISIYNLSVYQSSISEFSTALFLHDHSSLFFTNLHLLFQGFAPFLGIAVTEIFYRIMKSSR